ncbi:hypothetical protein ACEPAF_5464 [Sanghuangporus sanghuang]
MDLVVKQVLTELKSYAHVVLPTLFVYVIECRAHLKAWHAVRQLPHLEKEPSKDDVESLANLSESQIAEIRIQQSVVKKIFLKQWLFKFVFALVLASIVIVDQYITIRGWYKSPQNGEEVVGIMNGDDASEAEADTHAYRWYQNSVFGQIDWVKAYYPITLFLPAVFLISRALFVVSEFKHRMILRNSNGMPFIVIGTVRRLLPRYPALIKTTFALASISLASGALIYRSSICSMILFASMIHFMISDTFFAKVTVKNYVVGTIVSHVMSALFVWFWISELPLPIRMLLRPHEGETNWSGFIWSTILSSGLFSYVAFLYRMDHTFARPEERLVGQPDGGLFVCATDGTLKTKLIGTRISFCPRSQSTGISLPDSVTSGSRFSWFRRRNRWSKPYFHTAVLSWIPVYTLIAYLNVKGYIETDAESTGLYALYLVPPITCLAVILRAATKGREELKRVWNYKEDWAGKEDLEVEAGTGTIIKNVNDAENDVKMLVSEKN